MKRMQGLMLLVAVLTGLALAGLWWQAELAREQLRTQAVEQAKQRSMNLADAMGGQIEAVMSSLGTALLGLRRDWVQQGHSDAFQQRVWDALEMLPHGVVDHVSVVNSAGQVVYSSDGAELGASVATQTQFQMLRQGGDRLVVGHPVRLRLSDSWAFPVSRPVLRNGAFDGVIQLMVSSDYLAWRLAELRLSDADVVALIHREGHLLAHSLNNAGALSRRAPPDRPFMADQSSAGGVFRYVSQIDLQPRIAGWHRLKETGLVTVVGLSDDGVYGPLAPVLRQEQNVTLVLTAMLLTGAGLILLLLRRVGRSQEQLQTMAAGLEHRVDERTQELAALNAELESFAYTVSHDLRTPLRSINGFANLLEEEEGQSLSDVGRTYLHRIQASSRRMGQLITDMLSMAHLSRSDLKLARLDLSGMATTIADDLRGSDPSRQVQWEIEPGMKVVADPELMRAVLNNLLGNAWKYTSQTADARIVLRTEQSVPGVQVFCVHDNGAGFDMAYVQQLFQPFKRLHAHHEFEGSGVGLASVRRIIERHGGTVSGEGAVGQGACFRFTLPVRTSLRPDEA